MRLPNTTSSTHTCNPMPRTPLAPRSANARILKQKKTSKKELPPHKRAVVEGMHLASISNWEISRLTQTPKSTVRSTLKLLPVRPKGSSLPRSGCPSKLDKPTKRNIIRFCRQNAKATYTQVRQELSLECSDRTIAHLIKKQGIKK